MINIDNLDANMSVAKNITCDKENFTFYSIDSAPISLYGVFKENGHYVRIPSNIAARVSNRVFELNRCTAGGRIRFVTNSKSVVLSASCYPAQPRTNMSYINVTGFDLYASQNDISRYVGTFKPAVESNGTFEDILHIPFDGLYTVTINMPLYNGVKDVYIGIDKGAHMEAAADLLQPPVVYYGSSITQGGCASRAGCSYESMLHQNLKTDYINLGFSGNAKAEEEIMHYIAALEMGVFVYDYDFNAPNAEYLRRTHCRGYEIVRKANPNIPIILMTKPKFYLDAEDLKRNKIIQDTYNYALSQGDNNIYFVDGRELLLPNALEHSLVDNVHPNDLGFYGMYVRLKPLLETLVS